MLYNTGYKLSDKKMITIRKRIFITLSMLLGTVLIIKLCFAINNNIYTSEMEQMNTTETLDFQIESKIIHQTLVKDGYEIHYYTSDIRERETILFLHPAFSDHTCFNKQIDFFSEKFNVITIDLLGHGLSKVGKSKDKIDKSIEHINEILLKEGINTAHVVGVSIGSLIAQCFAQQYTEKVLSLTALGGYDISHKNKEVDNAQRKEMFKWLFKMIFSMDSFRRYAASITVIDKIEQFRFYESAKGFSRKSLTIMSGTSKFTSEKTDTIRPYPLLILAGDRDLEVGKKMSEQWHNEEAQSEFFFIKDAGHCAMMDNSEMFNKVVLDFIVK